MSEKKLLKRDDILNIFEGLSHSQGRYGRMLRDLYEMREEEPEEYDKYMIELENKEFTDPLDLIIYLEEG